MFLTVEDVLSLHEDAINTWGGTQQSVTGGLPKLRRRCIMGHLMVATFGARLRLFVGVVWMLLAAFASCTTNPHYIGDVCPGAPEGASACVTFSVGLDRSGVSRLPVDLALPGGPVAPFERLRGETAMEGVWTADAGGELRRGAGGPTVGLEAPFTDDTRAVGLAAGATSYVAPVSTTAALAGDDFAIEVVLRAAAGAVLFEKRAGAAGWGLREGADCALVLSLADAAAPAPIEIASGPLVEGAWTHCMAWVSRAAGGRIDCNGRAGTSVDVSALGDLDDAASPVAAGGGTAGARVALLAMYRVPRGGLGGAGGWRDIAARRFAALTGAGAVALGSPLPEADLRDSPAYVDLQASVGGPRRLFLVGPDWPRVACRTDAANARDCGYLSEPARVRLVPGLAGGFAAREVSVQVGQAVQAGQASQTVSADGETPMEALVPSAVNALHTLSANSPFDAAHHVFSFFARAGAAARVGASAGSLPAAVFDVRAGTVVSAPPGVDASIEAWGGGLFRCAYGFEVDPGPTTYTLHVADPSGSVAVGAPFAGDGASAAVFVAGLQVDVGLRAPGSLLAADTQAADHLAFPASDGNLPARGAISFALRVIAPAAARRTDQPILNLNRAGASENQVQLFVAGQTGHLKYAGVGSGVTRWLIEHGKPLADGQRHVIEGAWSALSAQVAINGIVAAAPTQDPGAAPLALDQIDVAFAPQTSDHLEGLLAGLTISTP
jgi:hypothetical protein